MAATSISASGYTNMEAAVAAMEAAIDTATEAIDAALQCGIERIGGGNWGYWVIYT
tara:strand:- start:695 stop:862 length:168 start_codon:yes stop_codon:yes gene_type:complete